MNTPPEPGAAAEPATRSTDLLPSSIVLIFGFLVTLKIIFVSNATVSAAARPNSNDDSGAIPSTEQWVAIGRLFTMAELIPGSARDLRRSTVQPSTFLHPFHLGTGARA